MSCKNVLLIAFLLLLTASAAFPETILIVADRWMPVNGEPGDELPGYVVEAAEIIFSQFGYDVEYIAVPWKRAIERVESGVYTALIGATSENTENIYLPEVPFGYLDNHYYTLKSSSWLYTGIESLENQKLGIISGYSYGDIQEYIDRERQNGSTVQYVSSSHSIEQNLQKLMLGRLTVLVDWSPVVLYYAEKNGLRESIRSAGKGGNRTPLYLGFNREKRYLGDLWDKSFLELMNNGKLEEILEKYNMTLQDIGLE